MVDRLDGTERNSVRAGSALIWYALAPAAIGAVTGVTVAALSSLVEGWGLAHLAALPGWLPALFSPLALIGAWLATRYVTRAESPSTSELYIVTYHHPGQPIPVRQLPGRVLAAAATVGFGGSQGFESPSALIGASWSQALSRFNASADVRRGLLAAGASAGIAAVFSSPAVGALYGIEVPFKRDVDAPRLAPCAVAAVCAYLARDALIGSRRLVEIHGAPELDWLFGVACAAVAIGCGVGAKLFAAAQEVLRRVGRRQARWQRAVIGGAVLALLAIAGHALCGTWITFGPGYIAAEWVAAERRPVSLLVLALAIRAGGNLVSVYGGGGGGVFTSLACNGLFIGQMVAEAIGRGQTRLFALLGAACFLGAGYRLPIACILYIAEESGSVAISIAGLMVIAIAQLIMGEASVSEAQVDERQTAQG
ncbi:MAG: chloride channel protein [Candidatus Binatia bacterium]